MLLTAALSQREDAVHEVQRNLCRIGKVKDGCPGVPLFESTVDALITIDVQHGAGNTVNINTENSVTLETINVDQFQSVVSQQENEVIIAGIADTSNINFVFVTFEGVHFESAVNMIRDFLNENSEGKK